MVAARTLSRSLLRAATSSRYARVPLRRLTGAGFVPAWIWKRLPVERTFVVSLPNRHSFRYAPLANDSIGRALFWRGLNSWEAETISVFYHLARQARVVLDIGANTGVYTLLACAANSHSKVIAFEPVPHIYERLVAQIRLNGWEDRCQARREAVSNATGTAKLHLPFGDLPTSASLHTEGFRGYRGTLIEIAVTTVDAICPQTERVDLVKIDVEGFEDQALEGMQRVLTTSRPDIIVECNPDGPFRAVETILRDHGYHFYHLHREGPIAVHKIIPDEQERYRNFLCTPRADIGAMK